MLKIQHSIPNPSLDRFVSGFYHYESLDTAQVDDLLLNEAGSINFLLSGQWHSDAADGKSLPTIIVAGPHNQPMRLRMNGQIKVFGVSLRPLGWLHLLGPTADAMANRIVDLEQVLPFRTRRLQQSIDPQNDMDSLIETVSAFLAGSFADIKHSNRASLIEHIDAQLAAQPLAKVQDLADAMEMSSRQLERVMPCAFGFGPKTILRQRRLRRSLLGLIDTQNHSDTTTDVDEFHDQSHMIREYRQFTGVTPQQFRSFFKAQKDMIKDMLCPAKAMLRASLHIDPMPYPPLQLAANWR
jgi:AraC-like DNA-binding protein